MIPGFHGIDLLIILVMLCFWIWMFVDALMHEPTEKYNKLVWMLVIIFTYIIGAGIYFFVRYIPRISERIR